MFSGQTHGGCDIRAPTSRVSVPQYEKDHDGPVPSESLHCGRSDTSSFYHRQPAVADAATVHFRRQHFP